MVSGESAGTSRTIPELLMEEMTSEENYATVWRKFRRKDTSPGIDGMTVEDLEKYLKVEWPHVREQLLQGKYRPQALKRKRIKKPGGGERELGIPTMVDRFVQAMMVRVLSKYWDATFSESSGSGQPDTRTGPVSSSRAAMPKGSIVITPSTGPPPSVSGKAALTAWLIVGTSGVALRFCQ